MVCVPCGSFIRGSTLEADEMPQLSINLSTFEIDRYEVTAGAYQLCVDAGACDPPNTTWAQCNTWPPPTPVLDQPVNCVNWTRADDYCQWQGRRLPTEAEWEKAARGDDGRTYPWGETAPSCATVSMLSPTGNDGCDAFGVEPVGTHSPAGDSPYGAADMAGNVLEWTADYYSAGYYGVAPVDDPAGPPSGGFRSVHGGSAEMDDAGEFRPAKRTIRDPDTTDWDLGFRCARTP
jgi:formylglycine-generating enzyme required for sulfatase activity